MRAHLAHLERGSSKTCKSCRKSSILAAEDLRTLDCAPCAPWKPVAHVEVERRGEAVEMGTRSARVESGGGIAWNLARLGLLFSMSHIPGLRCARPGLSNFAPFGANDQCQCCGRNGLANRISPHSGLTIEASAAGDATAIRNCRRIAHGLFRCRHGGRAVVVRSVGRCVIAVGCRCHQGADAPRSPRRAPPQAWSRRNRCKA